MQPQVHLRGVENIVHLVALCVQQLIMRHEENIEALNQLLLSNFGLEVIENGQQRYRNAQSVGLDEVLNAAACLHSARILRWKWLVELTPENKLQVLAQLANLAAERVELDKYLYFESKVQNPTYR